MVTLIGGRYFGIVCILVGLFVFGCGAQQFKTDTFQNFYSQGWGPTAMTHNGRDLVIGDDTLIMELSSITTGRYYYEDYPYNDNGFFGYSRHPQSIRSVSSIAGLAWQGECCGLGSLWIADNVNKQIVKLSPTHQVLKVFSTSNITPQGLAFDGKNLWTSDSSKGKIYKISAEDGTILIEMSSPIQRPIALGWDCDNLIVMGLNDCSGVLSECMEKRIFKINPQNAVILEEIKLPKQIQKPVSLAVSDGTIWVGDKLLNRVFKLSNSGEKIDDVKPLKMAKYAPTIEKKAKPIEVMEKPTEAKATEQPKDTAEEAKKAAEEARKAADEAKQAAEQAKKAFELQQKK